MARRLAAILAADVVGYSRLMAADEAGTLARLKALRSEFIEPKIAEHHGRIVKLMGDGALVEFPSVVEAVQCAVEIQRGIAERSVEVAEDQRIRFRIGVNLGDIIIEDDDIHGDGVNVAARLEALAEPGGICISSPVRVQVEDKLPYGFDDLGEQQVKNIPRPVHVFRVIPDGAAAFVGSRRRPVGTRWLWLATATVVLVLGASVAWLWARSDDGAARDTQTEVVAQAPLDRHRVAVLPLVNLSADPENEYFSDGLTEELISKLSRLQDLTVIARTSIMQYKGTDKSIAEIGQELRVGTILEGSVRKAGDRLRITAQLVDVESQGHLWPQDYDRELEDVFAIQSDVAQHVAQALQITLKPAEQRQIEKGRDERPGGVRRLSSGPVPLQHVVKGGPREEHRLLQAGDRARSRLRQSVCRHGFLLRSPGRIWLSAAGRGLSKNEGAGAPGSRDRCHHRRGVHRDRIGRGLL